MRFLSLQSDATGRLCHSRTSYSARNLGCRNLYVGDAYNRDAGCAKGDNFLGNDPGTVANAMALINNNSF